jgi:phosphopantetheine--protein transferase-like protein
MKNDFQELILNGIYQHDFAIGNDLVYLPDFEQSYNDLFQRKVFTENEIAYCEQFDKPMLRYASTWAAKEAIYKSIKQVSIIPISFKKIEIKRAKVAGMPKVILPTELSNFQISLSITHDGDYVWAIAIIKK